MVDYLPWLSLDRGHLAEGEVVTAELNRINLGTAGALAPSEGAATTFTPLIRSSREAMVIPADKVRLYPDPMALIRDFKPGDQELVLAARISGPLKSAFGDKAPEDVTAEPAHLAETKSPAQLIVVADTDLLDDRNWLSSLGQQVSVPVADNANLVANALDYLLGSEALTSLRGREVTVRPFTKVAEIRRASEAQYRAKEQELLQRLNDLQGKLSSLRVGEGDDASLLSEAQRKEIDGFRTQLLETRRELRDVQLALRQDIERLRDRTRFLNIAAVPLLVAAAAIVIALLRRARYRRRFDQACRLNRGNPSCRPGASPCLPWPPPPASVWRSTRWPSGRPRCTPKPAPMRLFPGLLDRLNEIREVRVTLPDAKLTVTAGEQGWTLAEKAGYPVDPGKVRDLALSLANLQLIEAKTADPERLGRLDLEEPTSEGSKARLVELRRRGRARRWRRRWSASPARRSMAAAGAASMCAGPATIRRGSRRESSTCRRTPWP